MKRTRVIIGGAALALLLAAFLAGRYSRPAVIVHDEKKTTVDTSVNDHLVVAEHELTALRDDLATWQARATSAEAHSDVITKWRYLPGKVVEVTQEAKTDTHSDEHSTGGTKATTAEAKHIDLHATDDHAEASHTQTVEIHTVTPMRPAWSVALMPGAQLFGSKAITLYGPAVLGASVEHRFAGPILLGAWGSTSGAIGATLRTEF